MFSRPISVDHVDYLNIQSFVNEKLYTGLCKYENYSWKHVSRSQVCVVIMTLKECLVDRFEYDGSINHVSARLAICLIEPAPYPVQEHRVRHIGTIKLL